MTGRDIALGWGFLGNAQIATNDILPVLRESGAGEPAAIASRDPEGARATADRFGIARVHDSYQALLDDPAVEAVYIGLPNSLHAPWIRKAAEAGKHVLCEKPLTVTAAEAEGLVALAAERGVHIEEALMTWSHPRWLKARDIVREGRIGRLRLVHGAFSFFSRDPDNIRNRSDLGGGALLDLGVYLVSAARLLFGAEPTGAAASVEIDPDFGIDRLASFVLDFPDGQASLACSTQIAYRQHLMAFGTRGHMEIELPFTPGAGPTRLKLASAETAGAPLVEAVIDLPAVDQYRAELTAFAETVAGLRSPSVRLASSIANLRVLDAIRAAGRQRGWIAINGGNTT
jgi:predicted dehydrogenase